MGRTFLDRLTSVFHEEELNDRADVLEVLGEARRRNVIDDEVFSMMEGAMPSAQMRSAVRGSMTSEGRRRGMGEFFLRKNCMTNAADSAHEHTVARPAPRMPPSSTMMNR